MFCVGLFVALFAACYDVRAKPAANPTVTPSTSAATTSTAFFATPPASLSVPADFTAGPFFVTDFLNAFFPGFGPTQTSVEPQPLITDPVVSILINTNFKPCSKMNPINSPTLSSHLISRTPKPSLRRISRTLSCFPLPN